MSEKPAITLAPLRRMIKRAGAKRVSDDAAKELAVVLEEKSKALILEGKKIAEHSNRRTVMKRDIKLARRVVEHG
ncbi:MAG: NFYB/HAP3 family transcription factor subunit [Candidatus Aenigmarchaeota archaeon]|nr:NFYB/HAP3 family transcription factor subunit [Candidatus Aenigmarchaeota archaeon]